MDYTHWDVELLFLEILEVGFLLACLLAEGFILSGILLEAQVILDIQNKNFQFYFIFIRFIEVERSREAKMVRR